MKLICLRISNFQSFGPAETVINLASNTFLIGPNGSGKTAVLQALARMFSVDPSLRRIQHSDFHAESEEMRQQPAPRKTLWIEADFGFPEAENSDDQHPTIPAHFLHMQLESSDRNPTLRVRLEASIDEDREIEESLVFVINTDEDGEPIDTVRVQKQQRNAIQVHYLPARRDPVDHISYAANTLLGRLLRAANWCAEQEAVTELTDEISRALAGNSAIVGVGECLSAQWEALHKGSYYAKPALSFASSEIAGLLRHLTIEFSPAPEEPIVDFSRLSDGHKSLLYLSIVLTAQKIGRKVLMGDLADAFDLDKLRPAIFSLIAIEEPENSLSPHYLGRIVKSLTEFSLGDDGQSIVATHSPSMLTRVEPEDIRYLRLNKDRETIVKSILMPPRASDAYKYVREAVQAFPELYFARLIIFGEGDSEEIVLPKLLKARGIAIDDAAVIVVPLGGRHVNHFWRLTHDLGIPQLTLLDLDVARFQGGWGRISYACKQLLKFPTIKSSLSADHVDRIPKWDDASRVLKDGKRHLEFLESAGVFFSAPLDLDFMMLWAYSDAYDADMDATEKPDASLIASVLGKSHGEVAQYSDQEQMFFVDYHSNFQSNSKPSSHLKALSKLNDEELNDDMPEVLERLFSAVEAKLAELPE